MKAKKGPLQAIDEYQEWLKTDHVHHQLVKFGHGGDLNYDSRWDRMFQEFAPHMDVRGKKVLAIGCNTGGDVFACLKGGADFVWGLELIPELASLASALLILYAIGILFAFLLQPRNRETATA